MGVERIGVMVAVGLLAFPVLAGAASPPTATAIRIGDHPAYVRAVVDFSGGEIVANEVEALGLTRISAGVRVSHESVRTTAAQRAAYGVTVRVRQGVGRLRIQASFAPWRIKYLSYAVVTGDRLAIDLWKSAPPSRAAELRKGARDCLALRGWRVTPGVVRVRGSSHHLFENTFQVRVRSAHGRVLGQRVVTQGPGAWSARVPYHAAHRQPATLEAVDLSPKDGALACLAQVRVTLPSG